MEGNVRVLRNKVMAGEMSREEAAQMVGKDVFEAQGKVPKMTWPTPSSGDWKDTPGMSKEGENGRNRTDQLPRKVYAVEQTPKGGGKLNPTWVEWLMGYPIGWTDLNS